jgi:hypothetical protein
MSEPARVNESRRPLRVGVVLESRVVPDWIAFTIWRLKAADFVELAYVVIAPEEPPVHTKFSATAFSVYERLDRHVFRLTADALEPTDLSSVLPNASLDEDLDVLVNLAWPTSPNSPIRARFGEWSVHHGGSHAWHSEPPFFWEAYRDEPVVITDLCAQRADDDVPRTIYRTVSATDRQSLYRTRSRTYWKVSAVLLGRLAQLQKQGASFFESFATYGDKSPTDGAITQELPGNLRMVGHLTRLGTRLLQSKVRKYFVHEEWFLGYRQGSWEQESERAAFRSVPSLPGRYFADPFIFGSEGRHYILFEDMRIREGRAVISYIEIHEDGTTSEPTVALEREYHLSYPLVFGHQGEVFMVPETSANRTIELYRAERFPDTWVLDRVLMNDVDAVDATLVEHAGRWWLFASLREHGTLYSDELSLFSAPSLDGDWSPHPLNPIVSDVRRARPAGRIFVRDGALIRPGQDSSGSYGSAVVFSRIEQLSETQFRETPISRLGPGWMQGNLGTHTYNSDGVYEVVDGRRRRSRLGLTPSNPAHD